VEKQISMKDKCVSLVLAVMPNPEEMKQVFDVAGYVLMGLAGMFSAWQRMQATIRTNTGSATPDNGNKATPSLSAMERLSKVEQDIEALRNRQDEMHQENAVQQESMLKQQSAMFDLLVQQRAVLDKILGKMGGIL
jgi:hypothetical protein